MSGKHFGSQDLRGFRLPVNPLDQQISQPISPDGLQVGLEQKESLRFTSSTGPPHCRDDQNDT